MPANMSGPNRLKAMTFDRPDSVPMGFVINAACWKQYDQRDLVDLMADHPLLFDPESIPTLPYEPVWDPKARKDAPYTDPWGCVWETDMDGIAGVIHNYPLADLVGV